MANKQIKQYSTSLVNPEMQTKITTRYNYMPTSPGPWIRDDHVEPWLDIKKSNAHFIH